VSRELEAIDPGVGSAIHPNDRQRIVRALEVYRMTGKPLSAWQRAHGFGERPFETLRIGLRRERHELYDLINRRSEAMIAAGLLDEVRGVVTQGYSLDLKPLQSVGYRQMGEVIRGKIGLREALGQMQQETRRLAKRQITWFGGDREICWFHPEKQHEEVFDAAEAFLRQG
jgi:tRNA dimethylallyltransferase